MAFEKIKFGWKDIIYIVTIVAGIALWYIDREITKNNHENELRNLITNTNNSLNNINDELGELTEFQDISTQILDEVTYHMKDKNIHRNMGHE